MYLKGNIFSLPHTSTMHNTQVGTRIITHAPGQKTRTKVGLRA